MKEYLLHMSCGLCGTETYEKIEAKDENDGLELARERCIDWADSYGFEQNPDYFGDCDQIGRGWDEDEEEYLEQGELEYHIEEWDDAKHEDLV